MAWLVYTLNYDNQDLLFSVIFGIENIILSLFQVVYDKGSGRSRGFGFVTMSSAKEVEVAIRQFNGYVSKQDSNHIFINPSTI